MDPCCEHSNLSRDQSHHVALDDASAVSRIAPSLDEVWSPRESGIAYSGNMLPNILAWMSKWRPAFGPCLNPFNDNPNCPVKSRTRPGSIGSYRPQNTRGTSPSTQRCCSQMVCLVSDSCHSGKKNIDSDCIERKCLDIPLQLRQTATFRCQIKKIHCRNSLTGSGSRTIEIVLLIHQRIHQLRHCHRASGRLLWKLRMTSNPLYGIVLHLNITYPWTAGLA
jgi:hypothetical protein